jgi:pimeloyl-ACP methyl ester carboxylesterase
LPAIETDTVTVDGLSTYYRRLPGDGPPAVFVHGNPTSSDDWLPFLQGMRGPAIALDLPGWGRSDRPPGFDYSMTGLAGFFGRFLDTLEIDRHSLVVHDWGGLALISAQQRPTRLERLVVINAVPLLGGYRWHRSARIWRTPVLGELSRLLATRRLVDLGLRESRGDGGRHDPALVEQVHHQLRDPRRLAAVLELYRSGDPDRLATAGQGLGSIRAPALVVWGGRDPYLPPRFGPAYAARLPASELVELPEAGHWPWLESPGLVARVLRFLETDEDFRDS